MDSFLIISRDKIKRNAFIKAFSTKENINQFDITIIERDTTTKTAPQSIGIELIKTMQKKLFLQPLKSTRKLIIIEEAHLLTTEAQNALLKVLEEPPKHTCIMLSTETKESLLPTIISRCHIVVLETEKTKLTKKELLTITTFIEQLPILTIGDKLKYAEQIGKEKEKARKWIENLLIVLHEELLKNPTRQKSETVRLFQKLYITLKTTNVNPRFTIEETLISLTNMLQ
jgi:hypothetical protein